MKKKILYIGLGIFLVSLCIYGKEKVSGNDGNKIGKVTYLKNKNMAWETDAKPIIATSDSDKVYVIWRGKVKSSDKSPDIMAVITDKILLNPGKFGKEWTSVPGINVYDGESWSLPQLLVSGYQECDPIFAWCQGEDLNLLVEMSDNLWHHLFYDSTNKAWAELHVLKDTFNTAGHHSDFKTCNGIVYVSINGDDGIYYKYYDGKKWSDSLLIQDNINCPRTRMVITEKGDVHIISKDFYCTDTFHSVIAAGQVTRNVIPRERNPIFQDCFDITTDREGCPLVAYQADLPQEHPDKNKPHLIKWNGKEWSSPILWGDGKEALNGVIQLAKYDKRVILLWNHHRDITYNVSGHQMYWSGQLTSFSVSSNDNSWSLPKPAGQMKPPPKKPTWTWDEGDFISSPFARVYVDKKGFVHMAWSENTRTYHAIIADLSQ